jgi:hypothetical protein
LRPALLGEEIYTPSPGRSEGWCDQLGSLFEPHHEQNPYANPKRTAKSQSIRNIRLMVCQIVQTIFYLFLGRDFTSSGNEFPSNSEL